MSGGSLELDSASGQWFSTLSLHQNYLLGLDKPRGLGPPRVSDSVAVVERVAEDTPFSRIPRRGCWDVAGLESTLGEPLPLELGAGAVPSGKLPAGVGVGVSGKEPLRSSFLTSPGSLVSKQMVTIS